MCPFRLKSQTNSIALALPNSLKIGCIDDVQKIHIRTVPLGETPRRITFHEASGSFVVLTDRFVDDIGEKSFIKLLDDQTFEGLYFASILDTLKFIKLSIYSDTFL
jgi:DNA damage-binding protein 1